MSNKVIIEVDPRDARLAPSPNWEMSTGTRGEQANAAKAVAEERAQERKAAVKDALTAGGTPEAKSQSFADKLADKLDKQVESRPAEKVQTQSQDRSL